MTHEAARQGFASGARERLPMPAPDAPSDLLRAAAQALFDRPRRGVNGRCWHFSARRAWWNSPRSSVTSRG